MTEPNGRRAPTTTRTLRRAPAPDGTAVARPQVDAPGTSRSGAPARTRSPAPHAATSGTQPAANPPDSADHHDGQIRLSKRMAELGLCSRREADAWIERGWVFVDGKKIDLLGTRIHPDAKITINRQAREQQQERITVLLHKPIGYVSGQAEDGYQPASVLVTENARWRQDPTRLSFHPRHLRGLAPAGRLDIDSTGLLVLTQDGRIARQLIGDDSEIEKEYLVRVGGTLTEQGLRSLNHGLELDGHKLRPARVSWVNSDQLRFVLREGRKRQIRRMCELVGLRALALKRVRIGRVMLGDLPPGTWRYLGPDEKF